MCYQPMCHLNVWFWVLKHEQRVLSFHHIDESTRHTIYYARTYAQHRALETSDKLFCVGKEVHCSNSRYSFDCGDVQPGVRPPPHLQPLQQPQVRQPERQDEVR